VTSNRWGAIAVNQADLRRLAEERIKDAKALIDAGRWEFAYYVAGYAVQCALKSCVLARMIHTGGVFDEAVKNVGDCRTHEFLKLMQIAGIKDDLDIRLKQSAADQDEFGANWHEAKAWNVVSRYEAKTEAEAKKLYAAITDEPYGVLKWIQSYW
jgi:HEPN domain